MQQLTVLAALSSVLVSVLHLCVYPDLLKLSFPSDIVVMPGSRTLWDLRLCHRSPPRPGT